jgi:hypothetical protein
MCAVSLPAGHVGTARFGVTLYRPGGEDTALIELAARLEPLLAGWSSDRRVPPLRALRGAGSAELLVVGART